MTVKDVMDQTGWTLAAGNPNQSVTSAYICDLLSWVMSHGREGTVWVTVQTHLNVVAVASLHGFSCVIIPENIDISDETIAAANEKDVCILHAGCTSYGVAKTLSSLGVAEV